MGPLPRSPVIGSRGIKPAS